MTAELQRMALVLLILAVNPLAFSAGIYHWTDDAGAVHFGDRPPPGAQALQILDIDNEAGAVRETASDIGRRTRGQRLLESFSVDRAEKKQIAAGAKARKLELARICEKSKNDLLRIKRASYLYDLDKSGKPVVRSDAERDRTTQALETFIANRCT